jgi:hypothetical protein
MRFVVQRLAGVIVWLIEQTRRACAWEHKLSVCSNMDPKENYSVWTNRITGERMTIYDYWRKDKS